MDQRTDFTDEKLITAARSVVTEVASHVDLNAHVELWNGERIPLGANATGPLTIHITSPGVITSILRRPSLDRIIQHYDLDPGKIASELTRSLDMLPRGASSISDLSAPERRQEGTLA